MSILIGTAMFFRAVSLVLGKNTRKFFKSENFLLWQKILALYYFLLSLYLIFLVSGTFYWFYIANLILIGLFYLQPTPRTTKNIAFIFSLLNIIALIFAIII